MSGLLIAILLGWAGGYRFYKKQYVLGFIYLITFGVCGIGWVIDIIMAFREYSKGNKPIEMQVDVRGAFAECKRNPAIRRVEIIRQIPVGSPLTLEIDYYQGSPYYQVVAPSGMDIGSLPSEVSYSIRTNYPNAKLSAVLINKNDEENPVIKLTIVK